MHPILGTIIQRLLLGIVTLFFVSLIIFSSVEFLPGDFTQAILGQAATEDTVAAFRAELGLDKPAYIRYFDWIGAVAQGDLGYSFSGRSASGVDRSRAVVDLVAPRLGNTLFLAGMAAIVSVPLALVLGITAALYRNSVYDRSVNAVTLTTISFPEFFLAYLLILFFASLWPVFPSLANVNAETELIDPYIRYFDWIGAVAQGDLGYSFSGRSASGVDRSRAVVDLVAPRLGNTLFLAGMAAIVSVPLALVLGITAALYRNSFYDRSVNAVTLTTISFPEFFLAYLLILFFASLWPVFPSLANVNAETELIDRIYKCILPALTLTLVIVAHMMRMTRAAIINLLASPYIEMSQLKGLSKAKVIMRHALPNAWAPIATVIAFNLAYLVVGVVVVEVVFVYPGIGQLMVDAVTTRDIPVVQACALIFATTYILLNLTADIIGIVTNPRLLHPR